jgi:hypothetical protein
MDFRETAWSGLKWSRGRPNGGLLWTQNKTSVSIRGTLREFEDRVLEENIWI